MILLEFKNVQDKNSVLDFLGTNDVPSLGDKYFVKTCEFTYIKGLDNNFTTSEIVTIAITNFTSVALSVIANYIYTFLTKNKGMTIEIGRKNLSNKSIANIIKIIKESQEENDK